LLKLTLAFSSTIRTNDTAPIDPGSIDIVFVSALHLLYQQEKS